MGYTFFCIGIKNREFDLVISCIQVNEQVIYFIHNFIDPSIAPINFIDHKNNGQVFIKRFFQHESCLGQGAFTGIHKQQSTIHEIQAPFHFSAKICVTRCIHDVDLDIFVIDSCILGNDRNAALFFQVHGIHDTIFHFLMGLKRTALYQHSVDKGGFPVVHVSNDSNIPKILFSHEWLSQLNKIRSKIAAKFHAISEG